MGTPVTGTIADIVLQYYQQLILKHMPETKAIIYYNRYVDDILIIFNSTNTSQEQITNTINPIHSNLAFTLTRENNNRINFLDLLFIKNKNKLETDIYRKPTTTDTTIHYNFNFPIEQK
jgi:hypothetical protein